jgi:hypothetical protein
MYIWVSYGDNDKSIKIRTEEKLRAAGDAFKLLTVKVPEEFSPNRKKMQSCD